MTTTSHNHNKSWIALNNLGVQLLEKGNYGHATMAFRIALNRMVGRLQDDPFAIFSEPFPKRRRQDETPTNNTNTNHYETSSHVRSLHQEENTFVYCHAFRIISTSGSTTTTTRDSDMPCQETFARDATVIMYNMAMVKHLYYLASPEFPEKSEHLSKAHNFYSMVHAIIILDENKSLQQDPYFRLVMMATFNNLAQIRFSLGQFQEATDSLSGLASLLVESPNTSHQGLLNLLVSMEDLAGFRMNLLLLVAPTLASAA
jgi:hypothetical protein